MLNLSFLQIRNSLKATAEDLLLPLVALLNKLKIRPNAITISSLLITIIAAFFIYKSFFLIAAIIIIFAGLFDMLDGILARKMNQKTKFGGFLDSTIDRLSDGVLYFSIFIFYLEKNEKIIAILCFSAMFFSFMVSYLRARASGLKIDCEIGIFTRPERIIILTLGLFLNQLLIALIILNIFSIITIIQRFSKVYNDTKLLN